MWNLHTWVGLGKTDKSGPSWSISGQTTEVFSHRPYSWTGWTSLSNQRLSWCFPNLHLPQYLQQEQRSLPSTSPSKQYETHSLQVINFNLPELLESFIILQIFCIFIILPEDVSQTFMINNTPFSLLSSRRITEKHLWKYRKRLSRKWNSVLRIHIPTYVSTIRI